MRKDIKGKLQRSFAVKSEVTNLENSLLETYEPGLRQTQALPPPPRGLSGSTRPPIARAH
jgi:hypothetical protein